MLILEELQRDSDEEALELAKMSKLRSCLGFNYSADPNLKLEKRLCKKFKCVNHTYESDKLVDSSNESLEEPSSE